MNKRNEEFVIASRLQQHRSEIIRYLPQSLTCLLSVGIELGLLDTKELQFYNNERISREEKIEKFLATVEQKPKGTLKFLQCIQKLEDHMGHTYLAKLLEGKCVIKDKEIEESANFKSRIDSHMLKLMDINLKALCPILLRIRLITIDELETLMNMQVPSKDKTLRLVEILDTKGPIAHTLFVSCLGEEHSHMYHRELYDVLDPEKSSILAKEKATKVTESPEKRFPKSLEMQGGLKTEEYARIMRLWRQWVSNGQWNETERAEQEYTQELDKCVQRKPLVVTLAGLLQSVTARIVRKQYCEATLLLKICDILCRKVKGDNNTILRGRCKYTWSWLYRYLKKLKKAKKCARDALQILFNVELGEDRALANYCYASATIDYHASVNFPDEEERRIIESYLQFAVIYARIEDRGLDHITTHSHLRLAQMYLGSTHYEPGKSTDPENIRKASDCLKAIDRDSLSPRSRCIFVLTESDLYRCRGDIATARDSVIYALKIAEDNSFETEITSAKTKLKSLEIQ